MTRVTSLSTDPISYTDPHRIPEFLEIKVEVEGHKGGGGKKLIIYNRDWKAELQKLLKKAWRFQGG